MTASKPDVSDGHSDEQIARSKAFFDRVARLAWSYSCSILIGCPKKPAREANNATGVFLCVGGEHFVVTASHVVTWYGQMLGQADHVHFQIGDLEINPLHRLAYDNAVADIAVIAIAPHEVAAVGSTPYMAGANWPLPSPQVGQRIEFCGYARINRQDGEPGSIESTILPLTAEVSNSSPEHFSVRLERDEFRWEGECLLKPDQAFLGGMSGGPALLLNDPAFPLVGIISQGNESYDLVYFRPLSLVPWMQLIA